jgi:cytidine deaminase
MSGSQSLLDLEQADQALIRRALKASGHAYAPYSGFAVGAAVRSRSGKVFLGANLENASYGVTMCAEVAAITAANTAGSYDLDAIAIVGHRFFKPADANLVVTPCGRCRQLLVEAAHQSGTDIRVLSCSGDLRRIQLAPISALLPEAFGPANLGMVDTWVRARSELQSAVRALERRLPMPDPAFTLNEDG